MTVGNIDHLRVPQLDKDKPFRGLISYQDREEDRAIFGGRKKDIELLVQSVRYNVLTVFFGHSGTGKTSLLKAGAMPLLRELGYWPIYIRLKFKFEDNEQPRDLVEQIKETIEKDTGWPESHKRDFDIDVIEKGGQKMQRKETLWEYFTKYSLSSVSVVPVLIFDQFEEIFTIGSGHDKWIQDLTTELHWLIENQLPDLSDEKLAKNPAYFNPPPQKFRVIFSIREDYAPKLNRLKNKIRSIDKAKVGLDDLTIDDAKDVIDKIQAYFNVGYFDEDKIKLLQKYLEDEQNVNERQDPVSITLGLICFQLNEHRLSKNKQVIDREWLKPAFLEKLIGRYYSSATIKSKTRALIENTLVDEYGHRLPIPEEHFIKEGVTQDELKYLVNEKRILRYESRLGSKDLEIVHDKLAAKIFERKKDRKDVKRLLWIAAVMVFILGVFLFAAQRINQIKIDADQRAEERELEASRMVKQKEDEARLIIQQSNAEAESTREEANALLADAEKQIYAARLDLSHALTAARYSQLIAGNAEMKARLSAKGYDSATRRANEMTRLALSERTAGLKLRAETFLKASPPDRKSAMIYALNGLALDSTDNELKALAVAASKGFPEFCTTFETTSADSLSLYFPSGKKLIISRSNSSGFLKSFINGDKIPFSVSSNLSTGKKGSVGEPTIKRGSVRKSRTENLITYESDSSIKVWTIGSRGMELRYSNDHLRSPVFSRNDSSLAFYDGPRLNQRLRVVSIYNKGTEIAEPLRKQNNWYVTDLIVEGQDRSDDYLVMRRHENIGVKQQIAVRPLVGGKGRDLVGNPNTRIVGMDYFPETKITLGYYQTAIRARNWSTKLDRDIATWESDRVRSVMLPDKKSVIVASASPYVTSKLLLIKDDLSVVHFDQFSEFVMTVVRLKVFGNKILILSWDEDESAISIYNILDPAAKPMQIILPETIVDATVWLDKYIIFQTETASHLWHFNMTSPGDTYESIREFYTRDSKKYPEFWKLSEFDRKLFDVSKIRGN